MASRRTLTVNIASFRKSIPRAMDLYRFVAGPRDLSKGRPARLSSLLRRRRHRHLTTACSAAPFLMVFHISLLHCPTAIFSACVPTVVPKVNVNAALPGGTAGSVTLNW